jgi:hypothetical protein
VKVKQKKAGVPIQTWLRGTSRRIHRFLRGGDSSAIHPEHRRGQLDILAQLMEGIRKGEIVP